VGLFGGPVSEQYHPYVRPQESGNKTDIRWLSLRNDGGVGLLVVGEPLLSGSALHHTQEDLDDGPEKDQRHSGELKERELVALNIDYKQMGVGGITSWGPTALPDYSLPYSAYSYSFTLKPYSTSDGRPWELARIRYSR
jgi:beta-galactosidase